MNNYNLQMAEIAAEKLVGTEHQVFIHCMPADRSYASWKLLDDRNGPSMTDSEVVAWAERYDRPQVFTLALNMFAYPGELWSKRFSFSALSLADAKAKANAWAQRHGYHNNRSSNGRGPVLVSIATESESANWRHDEYIPELS